MMNEILKLSISDSQGTRNEIRTKYYTKNLNISEKEFKYLYKKMIKINDDYVDITEYIRGVDINPNYNTSKFLEKGGYVRRKYNIILKENIAIYISLISVIISLIALFYK